MDKENTNTALQGITQLVVDSTIGVTDVVETMHKRVVHPPFLPSTPIQHLITNIAAITYQNIRWSSLFIGKSLQIVLQKLAPFIGNMKSTKKQQVLKSVLNGIVGDYLVEKQNPLAIEMEFKYDSKPIILNSESIRELIPNANGKLLVLIHGSCMNDGLWTREEHNHGVELAKEFNKTLVYLNYNSGLHISKNGQQFSNLLDQLCANWPVVVQEITFLAHSMGGLVARSAAYYGKQKNWTNYLKKMIFLGTPHHGAPLEKVGNYLDAVLENIPYTKPFAPLAKIRSAGVTDLRFGNLINEDWQTKNRFELEKDQRQNIPLPESVDCFSIAAILSDTQKSTSKNIIGDGLVSLPSALGKHKITNKNLNFKVENTWIAYENSHLDLLNNPEVYQQIKSWIQD
ncbi:lipase family alpha/beta hydrolase [Polaribacter sp. R77954]|uniref:lipase family alpha/beta hydrolase n=1 Tax=Polaribacter sp. R77954 TaxID=3093870 RepID=UPI0037CBDA58